MKACVQRVRAGANIFHLFDWLQKSYPNLPEAGEVELSFYNGLSTRCAQPRFEMNYVTPNSLATQTFIIDFSNHTKFPNDRDREREYVITTRLPNVNFTILETTVSCVRGEKIVFPRYTFGSFPEPTVSVAPIITCIAGT
jgi:hypothetical protein